MASTHLSRNGFGYQIDVWRSMRGPRLGRLGLHHFLFGRPTDTCLPPHRCARVPRSHFQWLSLSLGRRLLSRHRLLLYNGHPVYSCGTVFSLMLLVKTASPQSSVSWDPESWSCGPTPSRGHLGVLAWRCGVVPQLPFTPNPTRPCSAAPVRADPMQHAWRQWVDVDFLSRRERS